MKIKTGTIVIIVVSVLAVIIAATLINSYNGLIAIREAVDTAYANIDTQLTRRMDLIPNLVATVKGFAAHEQGVIDSVTEARAKLGSVEDTEQRFAVENELSGALSRLLIVVENYPAIASSENYIQLSDELAGTENRINTARRDYNETVRRYNVKIRTFPTSLFAGMMGFAVISYFEAPAGAEQAPTVDFG